MLRKVGTLVYNGVGESRGSNMVAMTIKGFKTENGRVVPAINDYAIGVSNFNEVGVGRNARFIKIGTTAIKLK